MQYKSVKTAVIGCGMISDIYMQNLKEKFSIIDFVGCSDIVSEKSKKQAEKYGVKQMTNEEILNDSEIELVLNLTYPTSHFEVSKAILSAGKHCYSEKLMCLTLDEAKELDKIRKEKNVMFTVAPDTFLGASEQTARLIVERGLIGDVVQIISNRPRGYHLIKTTEDDNYRKFSVMHEGGGIPYDMGGYDLHTLFNIFGPIESVCGFAETRNANRPYLNPRHEKFNENFFVNTENTMCASMKFKSGPLLSFTISSEFNVSGSMLMIMGTEGILHVPDTNNFGDPIYLQKGNGEKMEFPLCHPFRENSRGIGAADMAWALRTGRKPRLSFEMSYHTLEVLKAVCDSSKDGTTKHLTTEFEIPKPISTEFYNGTSEERSLFLY